MPHVNFVFAVHNHQPAGNFDTVFEEAYRHSYQPFLEVLERHPAVKCTQHWTGTLLEWLLRVHPGFIGRMRTLVERGQLELLTGAYYEAILAVIPEADRIGQIRKLTELIQATFGVTPPGMWLAERVWEPHLAASLARAGVEFVVVDDTHFRHAGLTDEELLGYYVTEELGETLKILPIDKTLRYTIPFRPVEETLAYFSSSASEEGSHMVIHADDGEKFGIWPKTHKHVYDDGWLESFCTMVEGEGALVRSVHLQDVVDTFPPQGRLYLPTDSYSEMTRWVLPASVNLRLEEFEQTVRSMGALEANGMFVRGGFWRNFLSKYPEANQMHKKMLRISARLHDIESRTALPHQVYDHLWAGQCNDSLWHGLFGGVYLPNLRFPVFRDLIKAESLLDEIDKMKTIKTEMQDFDCDGHNEVIVESPIMDFCFKPVLGGSLVELDYKPGSVNLLDVLSRREEASHRKLLRAIRSHEAGSGWDELIAKEKNLDEYLHFDWYRHASFADHFFAEGTNLKGLLHCDYGELGDFVNQPYRSTVAGDAEHVVVEFERSGALWMDGQKHRVRVKKTFRYTVLSDAFTVDYSVENLENSPIDLHFGVELALGGMAGDAPDRYYTIDGLPMEGARLRSAAEHGAVLEFGAVDGWMNVEVGFKLGRPAGLWRFPIETVSLSEAGFERLYQGSVMIPHWRFMLAPSGSKGAGSWSVSITQTVRHS
jgi:4-alpha-glucanotransferase